MTAATAAITHPLRLIRATIASCSSLLQHLFPNSAFCRWHDPGLIRRGACRLGDNDTSSCILLEAVGPVPITQRFLMAVRRRSAFYPAHDACQFADLWDWNAQFCYQLSHHQKHRLNWRFVEGPRVQVVGRLSCTRYLPPTWPSNLSDSLHITRLGHYALSKAFLTTRPKGVALGRAPILADDRAPINLKFSMLPTCYVTRVNYNDSVVTHIEGIELTNAVA